MRSKTWLNMATRTKSIKEIQNEFSKTEKILENISHRKLSEITPLSLENKNKPLFALVDYSKPDSKSNASDLIPRKVSRRDFLKTTGKAAGVLIASKYMTSKKGDS